MCKRIISEAHDVHFYESVEIPHHHSQALGVLALHGHMCKRIMSEAHDVHIVPEKRSSSMDKEKRIIKRCIEHDHDENVPR